MCFPGGLTEGTVEETEQSTSSARACLGQRDCYESSHKYFPHNLNMALKISDSVTRPEKARPEGAGWRGKAPDQNCSTEGGKAITVSREGLRKEESTSSQARVSSRRVKNRARKESKEAARRCRRIIDQMDQAWFSGNVLGGDSSEGYVSGPLCPGIILCQELSCLACGHTEAQSTAHGYCSDFTRYGRKRVEGRRRLQRSNSVDASKWETNDDARMTDVEVRRCYRGTRWQSETPTWEWEPEFRMDEKHPSSRSLTDKDMDEVRGALNLGFIFNGDDLNPHVTAVLPALNLYHAVENIQQRLLSQRAPFPHQRPDAGNTLPTISKNDQEVVINASPLEPWMVPSLGHYPADVKSHLKVWAQTVASAVRQAC